MNAIAESLSSLTIAEGSMKAEKTADKDSHLLDSGLQEGAEKHFEKTQHDGTTSEPVIEGWCFP